MTEELVNQLAHLEEEVQHLEEKYHGLRFVAIGRIVMRGSQCIASKVCSHTMAKRIANALNRHKPNQEGV